MEQSEDEWSVSSHPKWAVQYNRQNFSAHFRLFYLATNYIFHRRVNLVKSGGQISQEVSQIAK